jgi:hypothetical protein
MHPIPLCVARFAVPVVALLLLAGCDRSSGTSEATGTASADPGRDAFQEIPLPAGAGPGDDPEALARTLFGAGEPMEGNYSEAVETLAASPNGQVVQFTRMGLPDDSVRGLRYRLELAPQGDQWQLGWVGRQVRCWPGRGHEDWGVEPCQ